MMILHLIQLNYCELNTSDFFFLLEETSSVKERNASPGKFLVNFTYAVSLQKEQKNSFFKLFLVGNMS